MTYFNGWSSAQADESKTEKSSTRQPLSSKFYGLVFDQTRTNVKKVFRNNLNGSCWYALDAPICVLSNHHPNRCLLAIDHLSKDISSVATLAILN